MREHMSPQAEDRAHRIGQKRDVLVLVLVTAGTIEQAILDRAQAKRDIDAKVIQVGGPPPVQTLRAGSPARKVGCAGCQADRDSRGRDGEKRIYLRASTLTDVGETVAF